ncbi:hypothetical protein BGZ58_002457 [Dissophora ornata]|nr:hypothetical protein BGZ58_002457 [Dissophora ornata]
MDYADRFAIPEEEDLDIDFMSTDTTVLDANSKTDTLALVANSRDSFKDSVLELELALEEQTRDISSRFQSERRPEPAGLDRALSDSYGSHNNGFDPLSKEERAKKANRAQRFGAMPQAETQETQNRDMAMDEQGGSMDVDEGEWSRPDTLPLTPPRTSTIRPEAVHLYGTDEMSTKDILKYFEAYGPSHVEWIDDSSCNVVFPDQFSAKRALYFQLVDQNVNFGEEDDVEPSRTESTTPAGMPAGVIMAPKSNNRLQRAKDYIPVQQQHQSIVRNNRGLFVRYTTDYDRKERGAAAKSNYYATHGREEARSGTSNNVSNSMGSSRYGRRSRADEDEIWNRGRGITSFSRLKRKIEGGESPSPSPTRRRSWSRNRQMGGSRSRSRSSGPRSRSRGGSRSPGYSSRKERASRSPDSSSRLRADDYEKRGRRGDISLRLGGRVKFPDEDDSQSAASAATESRLNQYANDFMAELESTFSRREKAIPKTKMYSDYYEREIITETPVESLTVAGGRGRRENRGGQGDRAGSLSFSASPGGSRDGRRGRRGDHRRERERDREEALRAMDTRLGLPAEDRVDEFGRSRRD